MEPVDELAPGLDTHRGSLRMTKRMQIIFFNQPWRERQLQADLQVEAPAPTPSQIQMRVGCSPGSTNLLERQ